MRTLSGLLACWAARPTIADASIPRAVSSCWPTTIRLGARLAAEVRAGRGLDRDGVAHPRLGGADGLRVGLEAGEQFLVGREVGRDVALEDDGVGVDDGGRLGHLRAHAFEHRVAFGVGEPADLEGVVALDHAVRVVVDRLPWPAEQAGGGVILAEDQV